ILLLTVPNTKCRKDICSGAYRHKCRATDLTSGNAKEWYKHTFFRMRVYIRQSSKDPAFTQDLHRCHRRICFVYRPVSESSSDAQRHFFDHQIVERPREIADRLVYRGKTKNEHLPIAEMARRDQHTAAVFFLLSIQLSRLVVEVEAKQPLNIRRSHLSEMACFSKHAPEALESAL